MVTGTWLLLFHLVGNVIIPIDELIFLRGVGIPPTIFQNLKTCLKLVWKVWKCTRVDVVFSFFPKTCHLATRVAVFFVDMWIEIGTWMIYGEQRWSIENLLVSGAWRANDITNLGGQATLYHCIICVHWQESLSRFVKAKNGQSSIAKKRIKLTYWPLGSMGSFLEANSLGWEFHGTRCRTLSWVVKALATCFRQAVGDIPMLSVQFRTMISRPFLASHSWLVQTQGLFILWCTILTVNIVWSVLWNLF